MRRGPKCQGGRKCQGGPVSAAGAWVTALIALTVVVDGCAVPTGQPELVRVSPHRAFSDVPVVVTVVARGLRPALRVGATDSDLHADVRALSMRLIPEDDGAAGPTTLEPLYWNGVDEYSVRVPAGVAPGSYALELTDPRGATAVRPAAFTGLGPDTTPPTIELGEFPPGETLGSGGAFRATLVARDDPGFLASVSWRVDDGEPIECLPDSAVMNWAGAGPPPLPVAEEVCTFPLTAQVLDDGQPPVVPMSVQVTARDLAGHETVRDVQLRVAKLPVVDAFAGVGGGLGGRQPFSVQGRYFLPDAEARLGGMPIIGGVLTRREDGSATISGWTPPRGRAGTVSVEVVTAAGPGMAKGTFTYYAPPHPRDIQPFAGPMGGGTHVIVRGNDLRPDTVIYVGATREDRQPLYNVTFDADSKVGGCIPPGRGTVSVWAYDPLTGDGELPMSFTYQAPIPGAPAPPAADAECR